MSGLRWKTMFRVLLATLIAAVLAADAADAAVLSKRDAVAAIRVVADENVDDGLSSGYAIDWCRRDGGRYRCRVREFDVPYYSNDTGLVTLTNDTYRPVVYRDRDGDVMVRSSGFCGYGLSPCLAAPAPRSDGPQNIGR